MVSHISSLKPGHDSLTLLKNTNERLIKQLNKVIKDYNTLCEEYDELNNNHQHLLKEYNDKHHQNMMNCKYMYTSLNSLKDHLTNEANMMNKTLNKTFSTNSMINNNLVTPIIPNKVIKTTTKDNILSAISLEMSNDENYGIIDTNDQGIIDTNDQDINNNNNDTTKDIIYKRKRQSLIKTDSQKELDQLFFGDINPSPFSPVKKEEIQSRKELKKSKKNPNEKLSNNSLKKSSTTTSKKIIKTAIVNDINKNKKKKKIDEIKKIKLSINK